MNQKNSEHDYEHNPSINFRFGIDKYVETKNLDYDVIKKHLLTHLKYNKDFIKEDAIEILVGFFPRYIDVILKEFKDITKKGIQNETN